METEHVAAILAKHKRAEERLTRLNSVLQAIRNVNQLILRENNRERILQGACDILIKTPGYHSAWIALFDEPSDLGMAVEAGLGPAFTRLVAQWQRGTLPACAQKALAHPGAIVIQDPSTSCRDCPPAVNYAGRAMMAVRLEHRGKVYGLMAITISANLIAAEEEQSLLHEIAGDIAFALHSITLEEEHRRAEQALRESEEHYRTLARNFPNGAVALFDHELRYIVAEGAGLIPADLSRQSMEGKTIWEVFPPETCEIIEPDYRAALAGEYTTNEISFAGHVYYTHTLPVRNAKGTIIAGMVMTQDITERKHTEDALGESERLLKQAQKVAHIGHWELDPDIGTPVWSDEIFRIFGLEPEQGEPSFIDHETHLHPEDWPLLDQAVRKASKDGTPFDLVFRIVKPNGEIGWMHAIGTTSIDEQGRVSKLFGTAQDITRIKQTEAALTESEKNLSILLQELYHRTKNNMQVICALLDFQAANLEDEGARRALGETKNRIQSMALVHRKLYQSQDLSRINLREYICDLAALLIQSYEIPHNKVALKYAMEDVFVLIDTAIPCGLILNELISNALKYAFPGERTGEVRMRLRQLEDNTIEIQVADNGVGAPSDFDFRRDGQLGLKSILALGEGQLHGEVHFEGNRGVTCRLRFKDNLYKQRV